MHIEGKKINMFFARITISVHETAEKIVLVYCFLNTTTLVTLKELISANLVNPLSMKSWRMSATMRAQWR